MIRRAVVFGFVQGLAASAALAARIVVNDAGDALHNGPGQCAVTGIGVCTLRDAMTFANAAAGADIVPVGGGMGWDGVSLARWQDGTMGGWLGRYG